MSITTIVLCGGLSDERQVSVASGQNVVRTLGLEKAWFQAPSGAVHEVTATELLAHERPFEVDFVPSSPAGFASLDQALDAWRKQADAVFLLALHGGAGEDGTVQRLLEDRGIAFTGSGSAASAAAFDKDRAKELVRGRVPTGDSRVARDTEQLREAVRDLLARHERVVLKPRAGGSSRGLYFLGRDDDRERVIEQAAAAGVPYVVEQFLAGRELTVGVTEHAGELIALPVIEIEVDPNRAFDYEGKYLGSGTREICPARIPDSLATEAQNTALEAHRALGCSGYSRTDMIATDHGVYFLELNTLPGLTRQSLVPQELAHARIPFREFLEEQTELARTRETTRQR